MTRSAFLMCASCLLPAHLAAQQTLPQLDLAGMHLEVRVPSRISIGEPIPVRLTFANRGSSTATVYALGAADISFVAARPSGQPAEGQVYGGARVIQSGSDRTEIETVPRQPMRVAAGRAIERTFDLAEVLQRNLDADDYQLTVRYQNQVEGRASFTVTVDGDRGVNKLLSMMESPQTGEDARHWARSNLYALSSAPARNDPGPLTSSDPPARLAAGMITPSPPLACERRQRHGCWSTLSGHKWVRFGERRSPLL